MRLVLEGDSWSKRPRSWFKAGKRPANEADTKTGAIQLTIEGVRSNFKLREYLPPFLTRHLHALMHTHLRLILRTHFGYIGTGYGNVSVLEFKPGLYRFLAIMHHEIFYATLCYRADFRCQTLIKWQIFLFTKPIQQERQQDQQRHSPKLSPCHRHHPCPKL